MVDTNEIRKKINMYEVSDAELLSLRDEIDRLQKQNALRECQDQHELANASLRPAVKPKPQGKTVRAVIKVAVDRTETVAVGEDNFQWLLEPRAYYTLTADLPIPEETEIKAEVENV